MLTSSAAREGTAPANIPCFDLGGTGRPLHFLHANGYPPGCYRPLLNQLAAQYHVFGMMLRPLWPDSNPEEIKDWRPFSEDLRTYLHDLHTEPVIGMGHSIGAIVTLRAALREPDLFRALILMDPVLLPARRIRQLRALRAVRLDRRVKKWARAALRRRRHFDSLNKLFAGYRRREIFRLYSDENLRALIEGLTRPSQEAGYELIYSPEWEARIYQTGIWNDLDIWAGLPGFRVPTLVIRGAETDTFLETTAQKVMEANPRIEIKTVVNSTHLVPMEQPGEVCRMAQDFLQRQKVKEQG